MPTRVPRRHCGWFGLSEYALCGTGIEIHQYEGITCVRYAILLDTDTLELLRYPVNRVGSHHPKACN
jgi:hypothetical protein